MANSEIDNVYEAPTADTLPTEDARPMGRLVLALDGCLVLAIGTELATIIVLYAHGGSIWRTPQWTWQLARVSAYSFYLGCFLFLVFVYRAHRNARALGVRKLRISSQGAVGRFLVPIANLYLGYVVMSELWKYSDKPHRASPLVLWWWLTVLAYLCSLWFAGGIFGYTYPDLARGIIVSLSTASAILTNRLVHGIQARQAARARRLTAD